MVSVRRSTFWLWDVGRCSVQLQISLRTLLVALRGRQGHTRIANQVARLIRLPHHPEHQLAVDDVDLDWADSRPAIRAQRSEQAESRLAEPPLEDSGELRGSTAEGTPVHRHRRYDTQLSKRTPRMRPRVRCRRAWGPETMLAGPAPIRACAWRCPSRPTSTGPTRFAA